MRLKISSPKKIILYKILINIIVTLLIIWGIALFSEGVLLDFISSQISFLKLILSISLIIFLIYFLTKKFEIKITSSKENNKFFLLALVASTILVSTLAILEFNLFSIIVTVIATLLTLFYLHKVLIENER